ncbi:hypothetical protein LCGC14_0556530 [marine sediment metagenome]|uniref:Uncharacterized protein n=1 Tax=marine sediment metagenome TaxID=412755 RepID=A0A0F9RN70_9ZZZZ
MEKKQIVKLEKGKYIRIKGFVTMYAPSGNKKVCGKWIGGSSWTEKNPLIRIGKCNHKPRKVIWSKNTDIFGRYKEGEKKRICWDGRFICRECGYLIKIGKQKEKTRWKK